MDILCLMLKNKTKDIYIVRGIGNAKSTPPSVNKLKDFYRVSTKKSRTIVSRVKNPLKFKLILYVFIRLDTITNYEIIHSFF